MAEAESKPCTSQKTNPLFTNDVVSWPGKATEEMRDFWAQGGSEECQHLQKEHKNYISQKDGNNCDAVLRLHCFIRMFKW